jgi:hypothetical protein
VSDLVGVIKECNFVGKKLDSLPGPGQEGISRSRDSIDVRSRPVQQKFGCTWSKLGGTHQWRRPQIILEMWVCTFFQQELNKREVGHVVSGAYIVQGRSTHARYSVDVVAVFNELFC